MRKLLATIAVFSFLAAGGLTVAESKPTTLEDFKPVEDTVPVSPDEHAEALRDQYGFFVYKLVNTAGQCTGVVLAKKSTKYYQRLEDIGCDPEVDHVSFSLSEIEGYTTINFYHKTVNVGRLTVHQ